MNGQATERMPVLGEASFFGQKLHLQEQGLRQLASTVLTSS